MGVEMEVARRTSSGLTYVDKVTSDIFEDTCSGNWPTPGARAGCTRSRGCRRDIEVGDPTRYREPRRFEAGVRFEF